MELDSLLSMPRWKILEILAKKPSSPLEISQKLKTSVAFVSQQLKLLEAANLVTKEKTGKAEKGKPRNLYSLTHEIVYLTILMKNYPSKKWITLTDYHKIILRIWFLENFELHYLIEKLYWKIEEDLKEIEGIFFSNNGSKQEIIIVTESKKLKPKIDLYLKETNNRMPCKILSKSEILKMSYENLHPLYDPSSILLGKEMKGGDN